MEKLAVPQLAGESPDVVSAKLADRELYRAVGKRVEITDDCLIVEFEDGRIISTPLKWHPRLVHATLAERRNVSLGRAGLHWPDLDEDISYRGLLLGRRSGESSASLKFWMDARKKGKKVTLEDFMKTRRKLAGHKK